MKIDVYTKTIITIIAIALLDTIFILAAPSPFGQTPLASYQPAIEGEGFLPVASALKKKTRVPLVIPSALPKNEAVDRFYCT